MKRTPLITAAALAAAGALALSGCASGSDNSGGDGGGDDSKSVTIGITQIVEHPALDAAREGFKKALADAGYEEGKNVTYDEQNAQGDQKNAATIASKFASDNVDLVLAIATPTAQAVAQAIQDIPVLFTAVTDPVAAELVDSNEKPGGNVTGTNDLNPVADQVKLIKDVVPDAKTVGVVYSSGEVNSEVQVKLAEKAAKDLGLELKKATVANSSEIGQAVQSLKGVDALYIPTDNNVTAGIEAIVQFAEANKTPLFGAEGNQVASGAIATFGINYTDLGYQTGEMAVKILKGEAKPATMPVESSKKLEAYVNLGAAQRMGVTLPDDLVAEAKKAGNVTE